MREGVSGKEVHVCFEVNLVVCFLWGHPFVMVYLLHATALLWGSGRGILKGLTDTCGGYIVNKILIAAVFLEK